MKYRVYVPYVAYGTDSTLIEADTPDEAIEKAEELGIGNFSDPDSPSEAEWDWGEAEAFPVD